MKVKVAGKARQGKHALCLTRPNCSFDKYRGRGEKPLQTRERAFNPLSRSTEHAAKVTEMPQPYRKALEPDFCFAGVGLVLISEELSRRDGLRIRKPLLRHSVF